MLDYNREDLLAYNKQKHNNNHDSVNKTIAWGVGVRVNPTGTKALFLTSRMALKQPDLPQHLATEIWIKDIASGQEGPLAAGWFNNVLTWDENHVYLHRINPAAADEEGISPYMVTRINLYTHQEDVLLDNVYYVAGSYPYVAYLERHQILIVLNLKEGTQKEAPGLKYDRITNLITTEEAKYLVIVAAPTNTGFLRDLMRIDMETLEHQVLLANKQIKRFSFSGAETFLATVQEDGGEEESFVFRINSLGR